MATAPPPSKPKPPPPAEASPPAKAPPPGNSAAVPSKAFTVQTGKRLEFHKTCIYGPGGIGKTTCAAHIAQCGVKPLFIDLDMETNHLDVDRVEVDSWDDLRGVAIDRALLKAYGAVVFDSFTKAEELCREWVLANVKDSNGNFVRHIEDFGFHKGYTHIYETFLRFLGDLDAIVRTGKHVVATAHDCVDVVPNPAGEDWLQCAPRLQHSGKGKASIRLRVREWATHLLYIGYDTHVDKTEKNKAGKAKGIGSRMIYPRELPTHLAKSRTLSKPIPYELGSAELWRQLLNKED